jgi:hypothetical protein
MKKKQQRREPRNACSALAPLDAVGRLDGMGRTVLKEVRTMSDEQPDVHSVAGVGLPLKAVRATGKVAGGRA